MFNLVNLLVSEDVWWGLPKKLEALKTIVSAMEAILWPILVVVATAGSIYAVYLGIKMAKAEESGKRDEARKNVINTVMAMAITVTLILLIQLVLIPNIPNWVSNVDSTGYSVQAYAEANDENSKILDTKSEVEGVYGLSYSDASQSDGSVITTYRFKDSGNNKTLTVTYNSEDQVVTSAITSGTAA